MHQDVSTRRQQELLTELIELIKNRDAARQELDQQWSDISARCRDKFSAQRQESLLKLQQPRLPIWEDTVDAGYVQTQSGAGKQKMVVITDRGREFLDANQRTYV